MATTTSYNRLMQTKQRLMEALQDKPGIQGIGIAWDKAGNRCLRVSVAPGADHQSVLLSVNAIGRQQDVPIQIVEATTDVRLE